MSIRVVMWADVRMEMRVGRERVPWPMVEIVWWGGGWEGEVGAGLVEGGDVAGGEEGRVLVQGGGEDADADEASAGGGGGGDGGVLRFLEARRVVT